MREQVELYNALLEDVAIDYPEAARMGQELVTQTDQFGHVLLTVVDEIMIENSSRGTETTDTEGWIKASAVLRTVFQELKKCAWPVLVPSNCPTSLNNSDTSGGMCYNAIGSSMNSRQQRSWGILVSSQS
jgi:hypothetical protein